MADEQSSTAAIEDFLKEDRTFPPPDSFKAQALITGAEAYDEAEEDWQGFWARQAADLVEWFQPWDTVLEWELPFAKWFVGGKLNVSHNCLDRHVAAGVGDKVAYHWEGEPGDTRTITYADLLDEVQRFANVLKGLGVAKGDRVAIYMPMIPELPVAMLACARIGAAHSVVFGGFSADSLSDRINDAECKVVVTADGGFRRAAPHLLKPTVDVALADTPTVEHVVVVERVTGHRDAGDVAVEMSEGRDHWYHLLMQEADATCPPEPMDSEDLLYLLYTSGTTAKPKGIMHTTGGYLTQVSLHPQVRLRPAPRDRRVLVRRRHRLGDRAQLHRLRPARQRGHQRDVRGHARHAGEGPAVGHRREVRRDDPLHGPHRHPHVHEVGHAGARVARPVQAAAARVGGRAHQPRGLGLVLAEHRRRPLPGGRHLVADRDRGDHGQPAAGGDDAQARARPPSPCPASRPRSSTTRATGSRRAAAT